MKILLTIAAVFGLIVSGPAQDTAPTLPSVATPSSAYAGKASAKQDLGSNHTITLKGELYKGQPIDLTLRGVGPIFAVSLADPILTVSITAVKIEDKFNLNYNLSMQVPVKTGDRKEYLSSQLSGSIIVAAGSPETIITSGEGSLSLGIDKVPDEKK